MKRCLVTLAALFCLEGAAHGTRYWTDTQNTTDGAGVSYCPDATMSASCAMVSQADGSIVCVPAPGATGDVLTWSGTTIDWAPSSGGTVTSVSGGTAISISGTPSVSPVVNANVDAATVTVNGSNQLQRGALGGDVSASAGSNTVNVTAVESATSAKGYVDWTAMSAPANPSGTVTRQYNSLFGAGLVSVDSAGTARYMERDLTCGSNTWASSNAGGTLACTQPSFSNLSGSIACAQQPAFAGDLSSAGGTCSVNVTALEASASAKGPIIYTEASGPGVPASGKLGCWASSLNDNFECISNSSVTTIMPRTYGCSSSQWARALGTTGTTTCSQPAFSDLSGSASCAQLPALTGDVTSSAGSCAAKVTAVTDLAATRWFLGTLTNGQFLRTSSTGSTLRSDYPPAHLRFFVSIPSLQAANTANQQVATSNETPFSSGVTTIPIEETFDFVAANVSIELLLVASVGTASTVDVWVTKNGTLITGTKVTFTPGTTAAGTLFRLGPIATGSSSANDTYGLQQVYNGNPVSGPFGAQIAYTARIIATSY